MKVKIDKTQAKGIIERADDPAQRKWQDRGDNSCGDLTQDRARLLCSGLNEEAPGKLSEATE